MAILKGKNKALIEAGKKVSGGEINGRVKVLHETYTFLAEAAISDVIELPNLPIGAKVLDAYVSGPSLGATGIFTLGNRATVDADKNVIAADPDSYVASVDLGGAAALVRAGVAGKEAGLLVRYGEQETQPVLTCTEVTTTATGKTIEVVIEFTLD